MVKASLPVTSAQADDLIEAAQSWVMLMTQLNDEIADRLGVGTTDLHCLHLLNRGGPASPGQLASALGRSTGAVSHMLRRLEGAGYVQRVIEHDDRRRVVVEARPEGLQTIAGCYAGIDDRTRTALTRYSSDQVLAAIQVIKDIARCADEEMEHMRRTPSE